MAAVILKTDTIRVYVVRTLVERLTLAPIHVSHPKTRGALVYRRPRLLYLQSPIPYEAMRVFYLFGATTGVEPVHPPRVPFGRMPTLAWLCVSEARR